MAGHEPPVGQAAHKGYLPLYTRESRTGFNSATALTPWRTPGVSAFFPAALSLPIPDRLLDALGDPVGRGMAPTSDRRDPGCHPWRGPSAAVPASASTVWPPVAEPCHAATTLKH